MLDSQRERESQAQTHQAGYQAGYQQPGQQQLNRASSMRSQSQSQSQSQYSSNYSSTTTKAIAISSPDIHQTMSTYGTSYDASNDALVRRGSLATSKGVVRSSSRASSLVPPPVLDPVNAFSMALGPGEWRFVGPALAGTTSSSGRRPLPSQSKWSASFAFAFNKSDIVSEVVPIDAAPQGLLIIDRNSQRCRLVTATASNASDVRRLVDDQLRPWIDSAVFLAKNYPAIMPPTDEEQAGDPNLQNAWLSFLHALEDALVDLAALEYNKDLSDAYEPDSRDHDDDDLDFDTLSKGLILTPQEIKLLEYAVSKKIQLLAGIVTTLSTSAAFNMRKGDFISLWFNFDDEYGYGLNRNNGEMGFINLGHLDQRRLAMSTQAPPIPVFNMSTSSSHSLPPPVKSNISNASLHSSTNSGSPVVPLPNSIPYNAPPPVSRQYHQPDQFNSRHSAPAPPQRPPGATPLQQSQPQQPQRSSLTQYPQPQSPQQRQPHRVPSTPLFQPPPPSDPPPQEYTPVATYTPRAPSTPTQFQPPPPSGPPPTDLPIMSPDFSTTPIIRKPTTRTSTSVPPASDQEQQQYQNVTRQPSQQTVRSSYDSQQQPQQQQAASPVISRLQQQVHKQPSQSSVRATERRVLEAERYSQLEDELNALIGVSNERISTSATGNAGLRRESNGGSRVRGKSVVRRGEGQ
ncbi:hypothetical protein HDU79_003699 [Rhizoclosmatium sp. JEL0117]|nr:hypothetical protein HDU79_003699 [Rhizoclosmatium sp. JEL0117]